MSNIIEKIDQMKRRRLDGAELLYPYVSNTIEEIDRMKKELDELRPLPADVVGRIGQKLRLESNYHSNAIEGNSLTLGETRNLILHGLTARGKPMRDHLDIKGHDDAVKAIEGAVKRNEKVNEVFIRNLHRVLLKEPYETDAITPEGQPTKQLISIGDYKTQPNNVRTSTGEIYYFTPPDQVKPAMSDLIDWYRRNEKEGEHPIIIASAFHYCFVRIHPFDDGNGRMARLLMNMILIKHGYTVSIIPIQGRDQYINSLERADKNEDLIEFIAYVAHCCEYALNLHLKAARGEDIEDVEDIDKEIAIFLKKSTSGTIEARKYAGQVLYPFFFYCKEKLEKFSKSFGEIKFGGTSSVRKTDSQKADFCLEQELDTWPENAFSISTRFSSDLSNFQGKKEERVSLSIDNEADLNGCVWNFAAYISINDITTLHTFYKEQYTGLYLKELKNMFNEVIRRMMKNLLKNPEDREVER